MNQKIVFTIIGIFGIFVFGLGFGGLCCNPLLFKCYNRIKTGTIYDIWEITCQNEGTYDVYYLEYGNSSNKTCEFDHDGFFDREDNSNWCYPSTVNKSIDYKVGDQLEILISLGGWHCTTNINGEYNVWLTGVIITGFGVICLLIFIVYLIYRKLKDRNSAF